VWYALIFNLVMSKGFTMKVMKIKRASMTSMLCFLLSCSLSPVLQAAADTSSAIIALLGEAKAEFSKKRFENAAAILERALRIEPRNPVLWHNLAGVRLKQEKWAKSASLAAKSNSLAIKDAWLRSRNWVVITKACKGMGDSECMDEARNRAEALMGQ